MSSLSDILTAAKNVVTAINNVAQTYINVQGARVATGITAATVVSTGPGRVATVSSVIGGSVEGYVYDSTSTAVTTAPLCVIHKTEGVYVINLPVVNGIVVAPGTGQTVTISYS